MTPIKVEWYDAEEPGLTQGCRVYHPNGKISHIRPRPVDELPEGMFNEKLRVGEVIMLLVIFELGYHFEVTGRNTNDPR